MPDIFWCVPRERVVYGEAFDSFNLLAFETGRSLPNSVLLQAQYARTDQVRTRYAESFMKLSKDGNDTLIMLDSDMRHPPKTVAHLAQYADEPALGVVGLLYFRRGAPHDPCAFNIDLSEGYPRSYLRLTEWTPGLSRLDFVSTGAIAIKRWVFEKLEWPWFVYQYSKEFWEGWGPWPGEDVYFARSCMEHNIQHWIDTTLISLHLTVESIGPERWKAEWAQLKAELPSLQKVP